MTFFDADENMVLSADEYVLYCTYRLQQIARDLEIGAKRQALKLHPDQTDLRAMKDWPRWQERLKVARQQQAEADGMGYELRYDGSFLYELENGYIEA